MSMMKLWNPHGEHSAFYDRFFCWYVKRLFMYTWYLVVVAILMSDWVVVILPVLTVLLQVLVYKEIIAVRYHAVKEKNLTLFRTLNWFFLLITLFYFYAKPAVKFLWVTSWISKSFYQNFFHYHLWISFCLYVIGAYTVEVNILPSNQIFRFLLVHCEFEA